MSEVVFGSYKVLEHLGAGGMSRVDLARRTVEEAHWVRLVAIKRIRGEATADPSVVRMFCDEARIGSELHHQNIAQIYDFGREGDDLVLVMEYVPGVDLRLVLAALREKKARMPVRIALTVMLGVLAALGYAHARRDPLGSPLAIVHRDVNPRNVMVSLLGEVKLIDFGVALAADRLEQTEAGKVKGKFTYMAPEQLEGRLGIDGRADLFAAGLMLTEMVNGRSPFVGLTEIQAVHRIVAGRIPALDGVDAALLSIQRRALATEPDERYQTAAAFAADVRTALEPLGGPCADEEVAAFVRSLDPEGVRRVEGRIRAWRAGLPTPEDTQNDAATVVRSVGSSTRTVPPSDRPQGPAWWLVPVLGGGVIISLGGLSLSAWLWWASQPHGVGPRPSAPVVTLASPASRAAAPDTPGTLNVYTEPDGLAVYLDGVSIGTAPLIDVPCTPGPHRVSVRRGGRSAEQSVTVPPGSWAAVQLTLR